MSSVLSVSAEVLSDEKKSNLDASSMCLELALEGERLCKAGDCKAGIAFFHTAIQAGTRDLRTLSAIYSQLGNAYFCLEDYNQAMEFHRLDLALARSLDDKLGEAKSSGNLGNTLKVLGKFDEAALCCDRHLSLAIQLGDRLSEGRALYNLGNVYHAKGKHMGHNKTNEVTEELKETLNKAINFYQQNLKLMVELGDRGAQGRAYGNLGNTYYLLGDFEAAIHHHEERLRIAKEFGDKAAERRANSNLGNCHIFLGQFEKAAEHYNRTLELARELCERAIEAQSCYSLGNTYTLLGDFKTAIEFHNIHLSIAQELGDKVGEARAFWSLGNAYSSIGSHKKALYFAEKHYEIADDVGDFTGKSSAAINIRDLRQILNLPELHDIETNIEIDKYSTTSENKINANNTKIIRMRRQSMDQLDLIKITPDEKKKNYLNEDKNTCQTQKKSENDFFDLLLNSQSKRMDDQRCSIKMMANRFERKPLSNPNNKLNIPDSDDLITEIADLQCERMNEQRAILPEPKTTTGRVLKKSATEDHTKSSNIDDAFFDMLVRSQRSRLEEQRSDLPKPSVILDAENSNSTNINSGSNVGATVPDDDFFSLIMKVQSGRMDDQRATVPYDGIRKK